MVSFFRTQLESMYLTLRKAFTADSPLLHPDVVYYMDTR
jgi:hypothetical protein